MSDGQQLSTRLWCKRCGVEEGHLHLFGCTGEGIEHKEKLSTADQQYDQGWNDAIDHLLSTFRFPGEVIFQIEGRKKK